MYPHTRLRSAEWQPPLFWIPVTGLLAFFELLTRIRAMLTALGRVVSGPPDKGPLASHTFTLGSQIGNRPCFGFPVWGCLLSSWHSDTLTLNLDPLQWVACFPQVTLAMLTALGRVVSGPPDKGPLASHTYTLGSQIGNRPCFWIPFIGLLAFIMSLGRLNIDP